MSAIIGAIRVLRRNWNHVGGFSRFGPHDRHEYGTATSRSCGLLPDGERPRTATFRWPDFNGASRKTVTTR